MVIIGKNGMCLGDYNDVNRLLESDDAQVLDLDAFTKSLEADVNPHRVIVDCMNKDGVWPICISGGCPQVTALLVLEGGPRPVL